MNSRATKWSDVETGITQDGVIGSILSVTFINEISVYINNFIMHRIGPTKNSATVTGKGFGIQIYIP